MKKNKCGTIIQNINYCGCCEDEDDGADNVYSTEETICGTWIDGNKIYRKVIEGTLAESSGSGIIFTDVSDLKIDKLVTLQGTFTKKDGGQDPFPISHTLAGGTIGAVNMYYAAPHKALAYNFIDCNGAYSGQTASVVLEYTKQDIEPTA